MRLFTLSISGLLTIALLTACGLLHGRSSSHAQAAKNAPSPASTPYPDGARRITIDELETMMKSNSVFIVDVRSQDAYDRGHIPGSKLIPSGEILNHLKELPNDKLIVTYCS